VNFAHGEIPSGGNSLPRCTYSVAAQEMAKHCAKFGWPLVNDVAAVTKPKRTRSPAIAEGPRDAGVPVEIW